VAVGTVSAVPSGEGVQVRVAPDLWEHAIALVGPGLGSNEDPREKYRHEHPVEISIGGARHVFFRRNEIIEGTHVFIKHGFYTRSPSWTRRSAGAGEPAEKDECVALARIGCCPRIGANTSAYLLAADGLDIDTERVT